MDYLVNIKYTGFPEGKVVATTLPKQLKLSVKSSGFNLLINDWKKTEKEINIDINKARYNSYYNDYSFDIRNSIETISRQFSKEIHITKTNPESFTFKVKPRQYKTVPIKLNALISYANQFQLNGNVTITPSLVKISGDSIELSLVNEIETESLTLRNLNKIITKKINIKTPLGFNTIQIEQPNIILSIPVEKFTEATTSIPVTIDNVPRGFTIKTFPKEVKVTYQVPISKYSKTDKNLFTISADFDKGTVSKNNFLQLTIARTPEYIRNVRIEPEKVEFILKKL